MNPIYKLGHVFFRSIARAFYDYTVIGGEHLKLAGPALLASNHVSFLDPPFIGCGLDEDIYFLARKTLMRTRFMHWLLTHWQVIGVDREKPDPSSIKMIFRRLKEGKKVIVFPEGTRSKDGALQRGEPGVGMMIAKSGVPVIPVRIFGAFEALPRDKKLPQPSRIFVAYGKPWTYRVEDFPNAGRDLYQQISDEVMRRIGELQPE